MSIDPKDPIVQSAFERGVQQGEQQGREKAANELALRALEAAKEAQAGVKQINENLAPIKKLVPRVDRLMIIVIVLVVVMGLTVASWAAQGNLARLIPGM